MTLDTNMIELVRSRGGNPLLTAVGVRARRVNQGGAVGLDHTPERFTDWSLVERLNARTPIEGLWLTGQDTVTRGQPIVQGAGLITAFRVLGLQQSLRYLAHTLPPIVRSLVQQRRRDSSNGPRPELDHASQPPSRDPEVEHVLSAEE